MDNIVCFISHTWADGQHEFARVFANQLRQFSQMETWLDEERVESGQNLDQRIEEGLRGESDCFIVLLSPEFMAARNAPKELETASQLSYTTGKPLFPVFIKHFDIPLTVRGLVWTDLSPAVNATTLAINEPVFTSLMEKLASHIRNYFDATPDALAFMTPHDHGRVVLVSNQGYKGPHPYPQGVSTTTQFRDAVMGPLSLLVKRGAIAAKHEIHCNRVDKNFLANLLDSQDSVISYASSKINKCTELMLDRVSALAGREIRFALEDDLRAGKQRSDLPREDESKRTALVWQGVQLFHDDTTDHAVVMRLITGSKIWWIFAGCGRPGSVAARKLVFEPDWNTSLWTDLGKRWQNKSFISRVSVRHDRKNRPEFIEFAALETLWL